MKIIKRSGSEVTFDISKINFDFYIDDDTYSNLKLTRALNNFKTLKELANDFLDIDKIRYVVFGVLLYASLNEFPHQCFPDKILSLAAIHFVIR